MKSLIKVAPESFRNRYGSRLKAAYLWTQSILGRIKRQFFRPPFPKLDDEVVNLHLGCGPISHPKFINIDALPAPHVHYVRAINDLSPFKDNSVNLIYASHCLEHFPHPKVPKVLDEWFRVLKHEGILRLSVPDFDLLLNIYHDNENNVNTILKFLMGGQDYPFNFHMTVFNQASLKNLLIRTGFREVRVWQPGSSELTTLNDSSILKIIKNGKEYPLSLNIEAVK